MPTVTAAPFAIGSRVRLARPENPKHPRAGRTGTVLRLRYFPETIVRGEVVDNAVWMVCVRFDPAAVIDAFDRLAVGWDWLLFEHELAAVTKGGAN